ncbi:TRAP transporter small permease subunit [Marinomonas epiphytica]
MNRIISILRGINNGVAVIAGLALLACIVIIIVDILLREVGITFSGSEEISGYVMAALASWGISYGLTTKAHVRIDLLREKSQPVVRCLFDLIALFSLSYVAVYVAYRGWSVVEKTLKSGALSNTALEVPLIIPQAIWFSGWLWLALSSSILLLVALVMVLQGKYQQVDESIGTGDEV